MLMQVLMRMMMHGWTYFGAEMDVVMTCMPLNLVSEVILGLLKI